MNFQPLHIISNLDYYPFGMEMASRSGNNGNYRYGFQGQEKDDEIKGGGNSVNYKFRMHDPRLGRFFAVDPLASKYSYNSPYAFSENRVIDAIELEGAEKLKITQLGRNTGRLYVKVITAEGPLTILDTDNAELQKNRSIADRVYISYNSIMKYEQLSQVYQNAQINGEPLDVSDGELRGFNLFSEEPTYVDIYAPNYRRGGLKQSLKAGQIVNNTGIRDFSNNGTAKVNQLETDIVVAGTNSFIGVDINNLPKIVSGILGEVTNMVDAIQQELKIPNSAITHDITINFSVTSTVANSNEYKSLISQLSVAVDKLNANRSIKGVIKVSSTIDNNRKQNSANYTIDNNVKFTSSPTPKADPKE